MADIHIDDFFQDCAHILLKLYGHFPRKDALYVDDIADCAPVDEYGIPSERHMACYQAMLWLAEENYLRYEDRIGFSGLDQVTLTEKAFLKLVTPVNTELLEDNTSPPIVSLQHASFAAQLRQALNAATPYRMREALSHLWPDVLPSHALNIVTDKD
ncbi:MAG: hypothetical protein B0D91_12635 [Oceanospirillales bacterium LUC14_002_19_P2]|uniref:Uncharacterized protein n=1 Tax=Elysia marginata TaxID=1093978 RepID=A0AAV4HD89_9GAST|nr:MAG: hypothetical protein B0D91_12635 [Oceanospirillales bacterium LUC14_002_19_P2]GFR95544.1 hypothetical protein ElyMa_004431700 [Elysia marginata]